MNASAELTEKIERANLELDNTIQQLEELAIRADSLRTSKVSSFMESASGAVRVAGTAASLWTGGAALPAIAATETVIGLGKAAGSTRANNKAIALKDEVTKVVIAYYNSVLEIFESGAVKAEFRQGLFCTSLWPTIAAVLSLSPAVAAHVKNTCPGLWTNYEWYTSLAKCGQCNTDRLDRILMEIVPRAVVLFCQMKRPGQITDAEAKEQSPTLLTEEAASSFLRSVNIEDGIDNIARDFFEKSELDMASTVVSGVLTAVKKEDTTPLSGVVLGNDLRRLAQKLKEEKDNPSRHNRSVSNIPARIVSAVEGYLQDPSAPNATLLLGGLGVVLLYLAFHNLTIIRIMWILLCAWIIFHVLTRE